MIFTSHRRLSKSTDVSPPPPVASNFSPAPVQTFSNQYRAFSAAQYQRQLQNASVVRAVEEKKVEKKKGMKWAQPTWFLFHTLAEKIREDAFPHVRAELLNVIYTICVNLPCPDCARHAKAHMDGVNFDAIQTKEHLRIMLHRFHNEVNKRKGYPLFPLEEVTPKYAAANTVNIIHYFMPFFEDKHASLRMIADDLHRARIAVQLKAWFNKNIGYFDL